MPRDPKTERNKAPTKKPVNTRKPVKKPKGKK